MPSKFRLVTFLLVTISVIAVGLTISRLKTFQLHEIQSNQSPTAQQQPLAMERPAVRDDSFAGSQACAQCHRDVFDQYTASPMGQSMATVSSAVKVEDLEDVVVKPTPDRHYRVTLDANSMSHQELMLDANGNVFHDQTEEIRFVVGSGQRGRSYLIDRDGLLFQSPIGWYAHGKRWDLSPGYAPQQHARFSRRIGDGCLYCHAGQTLNQNLASDRYVEPVFSELAIGCERCHGPGKQHIQLHSTAAADSTSDSIVNPANLSASKRESVCNQCHLLGRSVIPRYGRQFFDFRPGDDLEDIFVVLSNEPGVELHGKLKAVNQVEQMHASRCYKASAGRLGCTTCHDPHSIPNAEQRVEHFRMRCLSCHETEGCSLDLAQRKQAPANDSCIHCHMPAQETMDVPHTSMTDHRILRTTGELISTDERVGDSHDLKVFENGDYSIPWAELERARGITLMTMAWNNRDEHLAATALTHLLEPLSGDLSARLATIDDIPLLDELAAGFLLLRNFAMAGECWQRMLELDPTSETALMGSAKIAEEFQDAKSLGQYLTRLLEINPNSEDALALLVKQRHYSSDTAGAIDAAERTLAINPTRTDLRSWLVTAYRRQRNANKVREHEEFLSKMGVANPNVAPTPRN